MRTKGFLCAALAWAGLAQAQQNADTQAQMPAPFAVTLESVLQIIASQHPYLQALHEEGRQQSLAVDSALADFDPYLSQSVNSRLSGYYSGDVATTKFANPLESINGEWYSQYQISDGIFPDYEGQYDTLSAGETSLGVKLSLLRGRAIDERRTGVANARLAINSFETEYTLSRNELLFAGANTFLDWYESHAKLTRLGSLRQALENQQRLLAKRVEQGDEASVTLQAFEANLLEVRLLQAAEEQKRLAAKTKLSYFIGQSLPTRSEPALEPASWQFGVSDTLLPPLRATLHQHPKRQQVSIALSQQQNTQRLARNNLLPKLDVKAEVARDWGNGSPTLGQTDTKVGLMFSYPLGNRKAEAKLASSRAKIRQLEFKLQDVEQKLAQQFDTAVAKWQQSTEMQALHQQAATLADRLQQVEQTRFEAGDTDIFVLNARQIAYIKAQLKLVAARVEVLHSQLYLYYLTTELNDAV